jgi:Telomere capping, CST complex subunit
VDTSTVSLTHEGNTVPVDVSILVHDLVLTRGQWIHVVGYFDMNDSSGPSSKGVVRAVMAWEVSPGFNLVQYEDAVKSRMSSIL